LNKIYFIKMKDKKKFNELIQQYKNKFHPS